MVTPIPCYLVLFTLPSAMAGAAQPTEDPLVLGSLCVERRGDGAVLVSWSTIEPALGAVRARRTDEPEPFRVQRASALSTGHRFELDDLSPDGSYVFDVESIALDGRGASASSRPLTLPVPSGPGSFDPRSSGLLEPWYPVTLSFQGPQASERDDAPNPFLDFRLTVAVTSPSGRTIEVPGFFDGDGSGGGVGNVWRARFPTHEPGTWTWVARFRSGNNVSVSLSPNTGQPAWFDGQTGSFQIAPASGQAEGFYRHGKLQYVGEHYLRFHDGTWFVKGGSNSPENLLAFAGFDNTFDQGGLDTTGLLGGLHRFAPHVADFGPAGLGSSADPLFVSADTGVDSRGLIGALNYLASRHVNSLFFLPMNLGGDGWEVCPFVGYLRTPFDKTHYDVSKLAQWNQVFEHAARKSIYLEFVLGETETLNEAWLDNGQLGVERKLFYREMVARFAHLPALYWNLSEESDFTPSAMTQFADYLQRLDPYDHPIGFHGYALPITLEYPQWTSVLGDDRFSTNSIQAVPFLAGPAVEKWRSDSAAAGRKWIVGFDEQTKGLTDTNAAELRKRVLYDVLFSGGQIEWYAGYYPLPLGGDLRMEDFRTREAMWNATWFARRFLEQNLPFWWMEPADGLVNGEAGTEGGAEVLALEGYVYAVYYPDASSTGTLDLRSTRGAFRLRWYDPRSGSFVGPERSEQGQRLVPVGAPPADPNEDWVLLVQR